jgi:phosphatidylglycerol lysyltransferase
VDPEHLSLYLELGLSLLKIGEEGRVWLRDFELRGPEHKAILDVNARLERQGCHLEIVAPSETPSLLTELTSKSVAWLTSGQRIQESFSFGRVEGHSLQELPLAIVRGGSHVLAFASLLSGAQREELSVDLIRYRSNAPEGVVDYLLAQLMLQARQDGYRWFNLGMAPLSTDHDDSAVNRREPQGDLVSRHGELFYQSPGLRRDKQRFAPIWTPKYLAAPGGVILPRILSDLEDLILHGGAEMPGD